MTLLLTSLFAKTTYTIHTGERCVKIYQLMPTRTGRDEAFWKTADGQTDRQRVW